MWRIVIVLSLCAIPALAQERQLTPEQERARQHYITGEGLASNGDWAGALSEFEQAYELAEGLETRYLIGLDIARANDQLRRYAEAVRGYEEFLRVAPPEEERRAEAERWLAEARRRLELERGFQPSPIGIAIAAVGGAAAIVGGIVGGVALAQDGDARAMCTAVGCPGAAYDSLLAARDLAMASDALLFSGLGIAVVGVILTFVLADSPSSGETQVSAMCTSDGCGGSFTARW